MANHNPKVDRYIEAAPEFARPILEKIRQTFHKSFPGFTEEIKWGHVAFMHKGMVAGMAAFKAHVSFGFWKAKLLDDPKKLLEGEGRGMHGGRLTSVKHLPTDRDMKRFILRAVELNETGVAAPSPRRPRKPIDLAGPADFRALLKKNPRATATFAGLPPSHKREYIEWIESAKRPETRARRLTTAMEWMNEGKPYNWKYMNCKTA